ncbi:MAG: hypothetical protein ACI4TD_09275 [Phocaeicola sp.]
MKPYDVSTVADYVIMSLNSHESFSLINLKLQEVGPMEHCENQISDATMMAFYGKNLPKTDELKGNN